MEQYNSIQQILKKENGHDRKPIYPSTVIQAVFDAKTGASLEAILAQFNSIYVQYQGSPQATRNIIPVEMRRAGLMITYMNMDSETITEKASSAVQKDNDHWGLDVNWSRVDELSLSGDIAVSANGTWILNGVDTKVPARGSKGDAGLTPWLKTIDNKLHYSYDNTTWEPCSDYLAGYFRFNATSSDSQAGTIGKIQISKDNKTWQDLSPEFRNYLRIQGYVSSTSALPKNQVVGTIYGVNEGTNTYSLHVWDGSTWVNNGTFTSIAAGVVQEIGDSETEVMSQKAVTAKLSELGSEVSNIYSNISGLKIQTIRGKYIKYNSGEAIYNDGYEISDYVNIKGNTNYTSNVLITQQAGIAFYDGDKMYISGTLKNTFLTPSNAVYVRLTNDVSNTIQTMELFESDGVAKQLNSTNKSIEELKRTEEIVDKNLTYEREFVTVKGRYIDYRSGILQWNGGYECVQDISIKPNNSYTTNAKTSQVAGIAFYDSEKKYISGTLSSSFITPEGAAYVSITNDITNVIDNITLFDNYGVIPTVERLKTIDVYNSVLTDAFSAFRKFGVIGDSLTVGHNTDTFTGEVIYRDIYNSWGQVIARRYRTICLNFGRSGATTKSWYSDRYCYQEFVKEQNLCQCYLIAIGTNDDSNNIGSIGDIDWANKDNNLDSFYGNYAKIIQKINEIAPNAIVFCMTIPYPRNDINKNNAIREICKSSNLKNVFLVDLANDYEDYFKHNSINGYYYYGHYNAAGYAMCASVYMKAISDTMNKNNGSKVIKNIGNIPFGTNDVIN